MSVGLLVLTNGVSGSGEPSLNSRLRLDRAMQIWEPSQTIIVSTGYTKYRPVTLDRDGLPITEAEAAARYLRKEGVPRNVLFCETLSHDTIGNVFYSYLLFIGPLAISHVKVVTSRFHAERVRAVAEWVFGLAGMQHRATFELIESDDPPMSRSLHRVVADREKRGVISADFLSSRLRTVQGVVTWLQREHAAYAFDLPNTPVPKGLEGLY